MDSKLTLSINNEVVEEIKKYTQKQGVSVSSMVENFFKSVLDLNKMANNDPKLPLDLAELAGVLSNTPSSDDDRTDYAIYLNKKYS